ncbi:MAG TPA: hypothetical protein VNH83_31870 [Bryobacteraceae bacterium]|nr:hypothetical protein [Bryobacteraceae bacterium]
MKVDESDFRRRYAELSDEGLLSIHREELVDAAQQCYDEELARRGLQPEQDIGPEPGDTDDEFVLVATFLFPDEAGVARALLRSVDVLCYLENEHTLTAVWTWSVALGWLRLMVPRSRIELVHEILNDAIFEGELANEAGMEAVVGSSEEDASIIRGRRRSGGARTVLAIALLCSPAVDLIRLFYL